MRKITFCSDEGGGDEVRENSKGRALRLTEGGGCEGTGRVGGRVGMASGVGRGRTM